MVKYNLTDVERTIIREYLTTGKKLQDFRVIVYKAKRINLETVQEDIELIKQFLSKIDQT